MHRHRPTYLFLITLTIAAGLASRSSLSTQLQSFLATYAGDTLWALMVFLIIAFLFPRSSTTVLVGLTLGFAFTIELSQLYQAHWINQLRATRLGALILGSDFRFSDLTCYTVGALIGAGGEFLRQKSR